MPGRVRIAVWLSLFGFIFSRPVGLALVTWLGPQPEWTSAIVFARWVMTTMGLGFYLFWNVLMILVHGLIHKAVWYFPEGPLAYIRVDFKDIRYNSPYLSISRKCL